MIPTDDEKRKRLEDARPKRAPKPVKEPNSTVTMRIRAREAARRSAVQDTWKNPEKAMLVNTMDQQTLLREHKILSAVLLEERRELGKTDLWYFLTQVLFPGEWEQWYCEEFHGQITDILQNLKPGDNWMFLLPREHKKSYVAMLAFCLWMIVRDPDIRIQLIGAREATVKKWSILLRSAFTSGTQAFKTFQATYPELIYNKDEVKRKDTPLSSTEWTIKARAKTLADPTFYSTYISVTGAGGRCDIQFFDDAFERRNCSNPQQSAKALQQMMDLFPLVETSENSKYRFRIVNGTRWSYHDPYGVLLGEKHADVESELGGEIDDLPSFKAMVRHAFEIRDRPCEVCPPHVTAAFPHGHPSMEAGEVLGLPGLTRATLLERYKLYCQDPNKGESLYWHQYLNVCLAPSDQKFREEWFHTATFPYFAVVKLRVLAIDSADKDFQKEGQGDYMVAQYGEFDDFGRLLKTYALHNNRWTRAEFIERIVTHCRATNWWPHKVVKEKFGTDTFMTDIRRAFMEQQKTPEFILASRSSDVGTHYMKKLDWIVAALQGPYERGEVIYGRDFPANLREREKYELTNLGQTRNDDLADSCALFFIPSVRVDVPNRPSMGVLKQPMPPPLDLYSPTFVPTDPGTPKLSVLQTVLQSPRIQVCLEGLPDVEVHDRMNTPPLQVPDV